MNGIGLYEFAVLGGVLVVLGGVAYLAHPLGQLITWGWRMLGDSGVNLFDRRQYEILVVLILMEVLTLVLWRVYG